VFTLCAAILSDQNNCCFEATNLRRVAEVCTSQCYCWHADKRCVK